MIERLCIIGVGLIGGSLARDLRAQKLCGEVVGASRRAENLERAKALGVIDRFDTDITAAVRGADMVVVAAPLGATEQIFAAMRGGLSDGVVVTDVGSAKCSVLRAAESAFGEVPDFLVPGHPIAGTEHSGVEASFEGLFRDRQVILTPVEGTRAEATARVTDMWQATGARVVEMDAAHHDEVLAATSHLPHMLAYTLVDVLGRMEERVEIFRYAAGGFRDFTRIASSDPQMWHDICIANGEALAHALEHFSADLNQAIEAIRRGDGEAIKSLFVRAKALRDRYAQNDAGPSSARPASTE
ncbi:MAG: prephenate dehydrogenase/arogenate dehydrogenase family protein [Gammaproteobacteria bacterium]|nr:prephenate dehydrogenase/arogenate dehydrogenase family protein [Gammaproteobacteria bacterium]